MTKILETIKKINILNYFKVTLLATIIIALTVISCGTDEPTEEPYDNTAALKRLTELETVASNLQNIDKDVLALSTLDLDAVSAEIIKIESELNSQETTFNTLKVVSTFSQSSAYEDLKNIVTTITAEITRLQNSLDTEIQNNYAALISKLLEDSKLLVENLNGLNTDITNLNKTISTTSETFDALSDDAKTEAINEIIAIQTKIENDKIELETSIAAIEKSFSDYKTAAGKPAENSSEDELELAETIKTLNEGLVVLIENQESSQDIFQNAFGEYLNNPVYQISSYATAVNDTIAAISNFVILQEGISTQIAEYKEEINEYTGDDFSALNTKGDDLLDIVNANKNDEDEFITAIDELIALGETLLADNPDAENVDLLITAIANIKAQKASFTGNSTGLSNEFDEAISLLNGKKIDEAEAIISSQNTALNAINTTLATINAEITAYKTSIANGDNVEKTDVEATKAKIEALSVVDIESEIDILDAKMQDINEGTDKDALIEQYNSLKTLLTNVNSGIDTATNVINEVLEGIIPNLTLEEWKNADSPFSLDVKVIIDDTNNSIVLNQENIAGFINAIGSVEIKNDDGQEISVEFENAVIDYSDIEKLYEIEMAKNLGMTLSMEGCSSQGATIGRDSFLKMFEDQGDDINPNNNNFQSCDIDWQGYDFEQDDVALIQNILGPVRTGYNQNIKGTLKTRANTYIGKTTLIPTEDIIKFDEATTTIESLLISSGGIAGIAGFLSDVGLSEQFFRDNLDNIELSFGLSGSNNNLIYGCLNESGGFAPGIELACEFAQSKGIEFEIMLSNPADQEATPFSNAPIVCNSETLNKFSNVYGVNITTIADGVVINGEETLNTNNPSGYEVTGSSYILLSDYNGGTLLNANDAIFVNNTVSNVSGASVGRIGTVTTGDNVTMAESYEVTTEYFNEMIKTGLGYEGYEDDIPSTLEGILEWAEGLKNPVEATQLPSSVN